MKTAVNSSLYKSPLKSHVVTLKSDFVTDYRKIQAKNAKQSTDSLQPHSSVLFELEAKLTVHFLVHLAFR